MNPSGAVAQMLDDEHRASLELVNRIEPLLARRDDAALAALAPALARALEHETDRHFGFEERELFPRLAEAGDGDLAALLTEEHETLRAVAADLLPLLRGGAAAAGQGDAEALRRLAAEWCERVVAHVQKETAALLPLLADLLDEATDGELALAYASA
ncbi:MAG: hemerythrin domain-containing protein [Rubrivivax sp.]|nr:hemerythrin domain-containing protein [Rubrivivax sp.]